MTRFLDPGHLTHRPNMQKNLINAMRALRHPKTCSKYHLISHSFALILSLLTGCDASSGAGETDDPARDPAAQVTTNVSALLPARVRRLTNAEFDESVTRLLGVESRYGASFTPDTRQGGFTRNDAQRIDPVFIAQLSEAAQKSAASVRGKLTQLAPCNNNPGNESCARTFIESFAKRAYRRPLVQRETDALLKVYRVGAEGTSYADGIDAVIQAVLQSPAFIYVSELGEGPRQGIVTLTQYEAGSALAFLLTGGPPDDALMQAAGSGQLLRGDGRRTQAQRLLATPASTKQVARMVQEWLGIDRIGETAKDSNVYPEFANLREAMKREADSFVAETMWKPTGGGVSELLSASWTTAEDGLARMYLGGQAPQRTNNRVSLTGVRRRGILNQGAFLAVNAHAHETAPVLRGVALMRRVICQSVAVAHHAQHQRGAADPRSQQDHARALRRAQQRSVCASVTTASMRSASRSSTSMGWAARARRRTGVPSTAPPSSSSATTSTAATRTAPRC